ACVGLRPLALVCVGLCSLALVCVPRPAYVSPPRASQNPDFPGKSTITRSRRARAKKIPPRFPVYKCEGREAGAAGESRSSHGGGVLMLTTTFDVTRKRICCFQRELDAGRARRPALAPHASTEALLGALARRSRRSHQERGEILAAL